jgi:glycosyltransferase involved in cell wall biosynthesis
MRVGFDARWYNRSGVGTYVAELLKALCEVREETELIVYEDPENPIPGLSGTGISRVPIKASKFFPGEQFELREKCKSARIDLFHCPYQYGAPLILPCPLVLTIHDLIPFLFRTRSWPKQLLAVPLVKMGYRAAALRAHHIITDSVNTALDVERILKVRSSHITPVHLSASGAFRSNRDSGETEELFSKYGVHSPYVIVASTGNWRAKNLETALRALALARRSSGIDFQTVVYGPGNGIDALSKRNLTFELNIQRVGYLPVGDLAALFRSAQLFITTSLYEGFGLPILEAMSSGCPVVTSNGGSLAEVAGDGAQVFDPMDTKAMAEAVGRLLSDTNEARRWRYRGLARASEFSWRKAAQQTIAVYRKVCHSTIPDREPDLDCRRDPESTHY